MQALQDHPSPKKGQPAKEKKKENRKGNLAKWTQKNNSLLTYRKGAWLTMNSKYDQTHHTCPAKQTPIWFH